MKRFVNILAILALILAIFTTPAHAMPNKFKRCPQIKQDGITYILWQKYAIVYKTPNRKTITIPNKIKYKNKTYTITAIWDGTFECNKSLKTVNLKAKHLDSIEDGAIFNNHRIKVNCYDKSTYNWLKRNHVNVSRKF